MKFIISHGVEECAIKERLLAVCKAEREITLAKSRLLGSR